MNLHYHILFHILYFISNIYLFLKRVDTFIKPINYIIILTIVYFCVERRFKNMLVRAQILYRGTIYLLIVIYLSP